MTDIRELRLAIEEKLNHRRQLITQNSQLRSDNGRLTQERDVAHKVMQSRIANFALDDCADQIINEILNRAMEASKTVAEQSAETGDYVVGIDIPSLHIRQHICRMDLSIDRDEPSPQERTLRRISL